MNSVSSTILALMQLFLLVGQASGQTIELNKIEGLDVDIGDRLTKDAQNRVVNAVDCEDFWGKTLRFSWIVELGENVEYEILMTEPGGPECRPDAIVPTDDPCSDMAAEKSGTTTGGTMTFDITGDELVRGGHAKDVVECTDTVDGILRIYLILKGTSIVWDVVSIQVDLVGPDPTTLRDVVPGDGSLTAHWDKVEGEGNEIIRYTVYYSTDTFDDATKDLVDYESDVETDRFQITGLENGQTYYVGVSVQDRNDNVSELSEVLQGVPVESDDFWEYYQGLGEEQGGFCFIATAAYGYYDHSAVRILRAFRDRVLLKHPLGRRMVGWYYQTSPNLARFIAKHEAARLATALALGPVVAGARLVTALVDSWQQPAGR